mgnify:CR=1 FL=1
MERKEYTPEEIQESLNDFGNGKKNLLTIVESSATRKKPENPVTDEQITEFENSFQKWGKNRQTFKP